MCQVKARIVDGPIGSERIAYIATVDGQQAEVVVPESQVETNHILAVEICREGGNALVQLPRETTNGFWRIWVGQDQVVGA